MKHDTLPIILREISLKDTENIVKWRNQENVRKHFVYQELFTKESHEEWMKTMVSTGKVAQFIIHSTKENQDVGSVFLRDICPIHQKAEFGIFIGEDVARGKGYGTVAAKCILQFGFQTLNLHKIFLRVFANNQQAIASYKKAGFKVEGTMKDDVFINGSFHDMVFMGILQNEQQEEKE